MMNFYSSPKQQVGGQAPRLMGQEMRLLKHACVLLAALLLLIVRGFSEDPPDRRSLDTTDANNAFGISHAERGAFVKKTDPCAEIGIESNAAAPNWDSPAVTTQCGALEMDSLLVAQPLGEGVLQRTIGTAARFGVTPRFENSLGIAGAYHSKRLREYTPDRYN